MMLQDVSSGGGAESSTLDQSQAPQLVSVKSEPPGSDSQPINFSLPPLSSTSVDGARTRRRSGDVTSLSADVTDNCDAARLQTELAAALATNLALQEELSARDFHLAQLAEDFFCLHDQFKQLARHFQTVLSDIEPSVASADQSDVVVQRITQNHTS